MAQDKEYRMRDFIYNNGLVNAFMILQGSDDAEDIDNFTIIWKGIKVELRESSLLFHAEEDELFEIYRFLLGSYYSEIMEFTGNKRLYVSENLCDIVEGEKVNKKPFAGRVKIDKLQNIYGVEEIDGEKFIELAEIYRGKVERGDIKPGKFWHGAQKLKLEDLIELAEKGERIKVDVHKPIGEIKKILSENIEEIRKSDKYCTICSSLYTVLVTKQGTKNIVIESQNMIYDFGNSTPINRDFRLKDEQPLCFMCDLFYRLGMLNNYFYNNKIFAFDSSSLKTLKIIKERLGIGNDYVPQENSKIKTNISGNIPIPISRDFSSMLGVIIHTYKKTKNYENILYTLSNSTIIKFDVDSTKVDCSYFYNRLSKMFVFLRALERHGLGVDHDSFFNHFMYYIFNGKKEKKEYPEIFEDMCHSILNFQPIEYHIFEAGYVHLSKGSGSIKNYKKLADFLKIYQKIRGDEHMKYEEIVDKCSLLGERIGTYAALVEEKNIVYQIREIGNFEKLIEFLRDFEYSVLKNNRGDMLNAKIDKDSDVRYNDLVEEIIKLAEDRRNISLVRDILGIFAVQSYLATEYAKNKGCEKK